MTNAKAQITRPDRLASGAPGVGEREIGIIRSLAEAHKLPRINVSGDSMQPWLREPMTLELGPPAEARVGDIIVFSKGGYLVAHRLVATRRGFRYACGDARPWAVEEVREGELAGKVVAVYESGDEKSKRIDDLWFVIRGVILARCRAVRVRAQRLRLSLARRARGLNARRRPRGFVALVQALAAVIEGDRQRFAAAIALADPEAFLQAARRHRCREIVRRAMVTFDAADPTGGRLSKALQSSTRETALEIFGLRQQINSLLATLNRSGLDFALLKGAARIYADAADADYHRSGDLDVLVRRDQLEAAREALLAAGYREKAGATMVEFYRSRHHHSAPLFPPQRGVPIELHIQLTPPGTLEETLDWERLAPHMETVEGPAGPALCLDDFANALHLAAHAIGITRLRDVYLLAAIVRRSPQALGTQLAAFAARQRGSRLLLEGVLALAARLAGIPWRTSREVERYLDWVMRREDIPAYVRRRAQVVEAWYADGGKLFGPSFHRLNQTSGALTAGAPRAAARLAGRLLVAGIATLYAAAMRSPEPGSGISVKR